MNEHLRCVDSTEPHAVGSLYLVEQLKDGSAGLKGFVREEEKGKDK